MCTRSRHVARVLAPAVQRVPIGRLLTEPSHELLDLAARRAAEDGTSDLGTEHLLDRSKHRVHAQGLKLEVTEAAKKLLVAHGYQPEFGARPLRRTIQTELDNRIASLLLGGEADAGDTIVADVLDNSLHCIVRSGASSRSAEGEE